MAHDTVFKFPAPGSDPITSDLDGWTVVSGSPTMKTWVQHTSADGKYISGTWAATSGTYHAAYTAYEFVHIIEGEITITPDGGKPVTVRPGDAFVIEADFKGTWEITRPVLKHFMVPV